jgi:hypothetical protein
VPLFWSFPPVSGCAHLYAKLNLVRSLVGSRRRLHSNVESDLFCCRTEWSEDNHSKDCRIDRLWLWLLLASCPFPWVERPGCLVHVPYLSRCSIAKDPRFERLPCTHSGTYADDCLVERVRQVGSPPTMGTNKQQCRYIYALGPSQVEGMRWWKEDAFRRAGPQGICNLWTYAFSSLASTTFTSNALTLVFQHKCYIVATCDRDLKRRIRKVSKRPVPAPCRWLELLKVGLV